MTQPDCALADQSVFFAGLIEGMEELVAAVDQEFRYVACNHAYREAFAARHGIAVRVGMRVHDALKHDPSALADVIDNWTRALRGESFRVFESDDDGPGRSLRRVNYSPIRSSHGQVIGATQLTRIVMDAQQCASSASAMMASGAATQEVLTGALRESERRFRTLVEATTAVVWSMDSSGRCTCPSPSWTAYTGQTWDNCCGAGAFLAVHPEDSPRVEATWAKCAREAKPFDCEYRLWHASSNQYRHVRARAVPVQGPGQDCDEWIGTISDIDDAVRDRQALAQAYARLQLVFDHAPIAILAWDADLRVTEYSPAAEGIFGWTAQEVLGSRIDHLPCIHESAVGDVLANLQSMVAGETNYYGSFSRNYTKAGDVVECEWHTVGVFEADGRFRCGIALARDITPRDAAQQQLRQLRAKMQAATEVAGLGFFEVDLAAGHCYYSPEWKRHVGYEAHELSDSLMEWTSRLHPDDEQRVMGALGSGSGGPCETEFRLRHRDGSYRWIICRLAPVSKGDELNPKGERSGHGPHLLGATLDITERKQADEARRDSETYMEIAIEAANIGTWHRDLSDDGYVVSAQVCGIYGLPLVSARWTEDAFGSRLHPEDREKVAQQLARSAQLGVPYDCEHRIVRPDGSVRWVHCLAKQVPGPNGLPERMTGIVIDIDQRKQAENKLRLAAKALESAAEGVMITQHGAIIQCNRAFSAITGYSEDEVLGRHVSMLHSDAFDRKHADERRIAVDRHGHWQGEIWGRRKNGEVYPAWVSLSVVEDEIMGRYYVSVFSDISANKEAEARLEYLAHHDALTGLPNRVLLQERLREMLHRAGRHHTQAAVLYIDLDRFKPVNDSLGHEVGDQLLQAVAQRLCGCVRKTDTVARLGGDEFMVLLDDLHESDEAAWVAQNILNGLTKAFNLGGKHIYISASVGIACFPSDGKTADLLLRHADVAMYKAKEEGKNAYRFFSRGMNRHAKEKLFLSNSLRTALERNELRVDYQPRVSIETGSVTGAEALVRWHSPEHGLILPARFIGLAEETGMIEPIGEWVLKTACQQMQSWKDRGCAPQFVSVNISPRQFNQARLVERIAAILEETGLEAQMLELEITEGIVMSNPERARKVLQRLADLGVKLSLDDFGTGYSSLGYLRRFPIHHLKIDRSFVQDVPASEDANAITRAIIALAHSLKLEVTAEGVETQAQRDFIVAEGCHAWQGYLFSEPVAARELELFLKKGTY